MMSAIKTRTILAVALAALLAGVAPVVADVRTPTPESVGGVNPQCPGDTDGDMVPEPGAPGYDPNNVCVHLTGGDGFAVMADGHPQYIFGFADVTGVPRDQVMQVGTLQARWPAPTLRFKEGQHVYLSLTNVGMVMRPDLFDPHSVHYHGFPQSSSVFDGLPESALSINMGSTLTYFYRQEEPGTYMYHCHVEATEHMEMGMLGNLYVEAAQNELPDGTNLNGYIHHTGMRYVYNDGDGSTRYDAEYVVQLAGFDADFHDQHIAVQPLPFAEMRVTHPMINGRGYPDTIYEAAIPNLHDGTEAQEMDAKVVAVRGERTLLRISSLELVSESTLALDGIPMRVVGKDAVRVRSAKTGENLSYLTQSISLGGGETYDVILDLETYDIPAGVYPLYTTNLNHLSNGDQDFGGMMTEVWVVEPVK